MPPPTPPRIKVDARRAQRLREVCARIDYGFTNLGLLHRALTHSSLGNEGAPDYERLEFLGDAVLGFLVAEELYRRTPEIPEGELTSRRSLMVSRKPLATVAEELGLGGYLLVGRGLTEDNLRSPRILADLVEAVLAAIYLDGGIKAARRFVHRFIVERFRGQDELQGITDAKTRLNQWAQSHDLGSPNYQIVEATGPDHDPTFRIAVTLDGITCQSSEVKSKQVGEQEVAAQCLKDLIRSAEDPAEDDAADDDAADDDAADDDAAGDDLAGKAHADDEPADDELRDDELADDELADDEPAGDDFADSELTGDDPTDDHDHPDYGPADSEDTEFETGRDSAVSPRRPPTKMPRPATSSRRTSKSKSKRGSAPTSDAKSGPNRARAGSEQAAEDDVQIIWDEPRPPRA